MGAGIECPWRPQRIRWRGSQGSLADWATDSLEAAKLLYVQPGSQGLLKPGTKLGEEYLSGCPPIVRMQLARAGLRLAWVLNQIFR